jgi:hypothetical protein
VTATLVPPTSDPFFTPRLSWRFTSVISVASVAWYYILKSDRINRRPGGRLEAVRRRRRERDWRWAGGCGADQEALAVVLDLGLGQRVDRRRSAAMNQSGRVQRYDLRAPS